MFRYSCSCCDLVNWLFYQVSVRHGVLFPRRKGWSFYLKLVYPGGVEAARTLVMVSNGKECLLFIPVDGSVDESIWPRLVHHRFIQAWKEEIGAEDTPYQVVWLTSEKYEARLITKINDARLKGELLVMKHDRLEFAAGGFRNPRLEFRLSQADFDPDLIPCQILVDFAASVDNECKYLFYQDLFHRISRHWLNGTETVGLRELIREVIPYWKQYQRGEQQRICRKVRSELEAVFDQAFQDWLVMEDHRKKPDSHPETVVRLLRRPEDPKSISLWLKKQRMALDYLNSLLNTVALDFLSRAI